MVFDMRDFGVLMLCGVCRYLPTALAKYFDSPFFDVRLLRTLRNHNLIKIQSNNLSYKLTYTGCEVLAEMGYTFPQDKRLDIKKESYRRKLRNALFNVTLFLAEINIFYDSSLSLANKNIGYVSSLMVRADNRIKPLAGTRFLGILKIADTAYVSYFVDNKDDWIVPNYEREIYSAQISVMGNIKKTQIILAGISLEELWKNVFPKVQSEPHSNGCKCFDIALEELGSDFLLVPTDSNGVLQMSILQIAGYRDRILRVLECTKDVPEELFECDGIKDNIPYIIALDMNVNRIVRALRQVERFDKNAVPKIYYLPFQEEVIFMLLKRYWRKDISIGKLTDKNISIMFPEAIHEYNPLSPYTNEKGVTYDASERRVRKDDIELPENWETHTQDKR